LKKKTVAIVYGTRPEAIKLIPVYLNLIKNKNLEVHLVSTGQHQKMLDDVLQFFTIQADYNLQVMQQNQTLPDYEWVKWKCSFKRLLIYVIGNLNINVSSGSK